MRDSEGRDMWKILATFVFIPLASFSIGSTGTYFLQTKQIRETQIEYGQRIGSAERSVIAEASERKNSDDSRDRIIETRVTNILRNMEQVIAQNTSIVQQNTELIAIIKIQNGMKP